MTGFFVLDVSEFASLIHVAERTAECTVHRPVNGYWFVEFRGTLRIRRSDTTMSDAVWFGCLTAGLMGKITKFDMDTLELVATNEPIIEPLQAS
jgi:hypothetical protein